jgi:hypothetical protein
MGSRGIVPLILNSALDGDEWSASHPSHFTLPDKTPVPTEKQIKLHNLLLDCITLEDGADRLSQNSDN